MILDEAHMIKNIKSERYKRLQNLNVSKSISYYLGLVLEGDWFYNFGKILEGYFSEDYSFRKQPVLTWDLFKFQRSLLL